MNELYWITRLDAINDGLKVATILSGLLLAASIVVCIIAKTQSKIGAYESCREESKAIFEIWQPIRNWTAVFFVLFLPLFVFVPTTKETMLIWGVGSTIDYIKTNETILQLPDKCVDALDAWVDSLSENKKEDLE